MYDIEHAIEVFVRGSFEDVNAFRIRLAHTAKMMAEVAFGNELREDGLIERGWMKIDESASCCERLYETLGQDHEAKTQRVEEHLREGANVDNATRTVETLQSSNGATRVAVLRVVIIFDNPGVRAGSPAEKFQAAVRGHGDAHRKFIRRGDISERCFGRTLAACLYDEALSIHGYWNNTRSCSTEGLKSTGIAGVFHP